MNAWRCSPHLDVQIITEKPQSRTSQLCCFAGREGEWEAESAATDECLVYTLLSRPLPDYALQHTFSQFGSVMYVRLQRDARFGIVKFTNADSARAALAALNGTNICGQALAVSLVDPLQSSRITKRARVAE